MEMMAGPCQALTPAIRPVVLPDWLGPKMATAPGDARAGRRWLGASVDRYRRPPAGEHEPVRLGRAGESGARSRRVASRGWVATPSRRRLSIGSCRLRPTKDSDADDDSGDQRRGRARSRSSTGRARAGCSRPRAGHARAGSSECAEQVHRAATDGVERAGVQQPGVGRGGRRGYRSAIARPPTGEDGDRARTERTGRRRRRWSGGGAGGSCDLRDGSRTSMAAVLARLTSSAVDDVGEVVGAVLAEVEGAGDGVEVVLLRGRGSAPCSRARRRGCRRRAAAPRRR